MNFDIMNSDVNIMNFDIMNSDVNIMNFVIMNSDVNIMNFISVASLLVIKVWLMKDTPESLIAETTVNASVE